MSIDPSPLQPSPFDIYRLYLSTAEKVSDRRADTNKWMLSVNGAIISLYGLLDSMANDQYGHWVAIIPLAGILVSIAWVGLIITYQKLNSAKFKVLQEIESGFTFQPLTNEQAYYELDRRTSASKIEKLIPCSFALLYLATLILPQLI